MSMKDLTSNTYVTSDISKENVRSDVSSGICNKGIQIKEDL